MLVLITVFSGVMRGCFGDASYYITEIQNKKSPVITELFLFSNAYKNTINVLGGIRTPDRWLRRPLLYPAELPGHFLTQELLYLSGGVLAIVL